MTSKKTIAFALIGVLFQLGAYAAETEAKKIYDNATKEMETISYSSIRSSVGQGEPDNIFQKKLDDGSVCSRLESKGRDGSIRTISITNANGSYLLYPVLKKGIKEYEPRAKQEVLEELDTKANYTVDEDAAQEYYLLTKEVKLDEDAIRQYKKIVPARMVASKGDDEIKRGLQRIFPAKTVYHIRKSDSFMLSCERYNADGKLLYKSMDEKIVINPAMDSAMFELPSDYEIIEPKSLEEYFAGSRKIDEELTNHITKNVLTGPVAGNEMKNTNISQTKSSWFQQVSTWCRENIVITAISALGIVILFIAIAIGVRKRR